jgi:hypothetical protein
MKRPRDVSAPGVMVRIQNEEENSDMKTMKLFASSIKTLCSGCLVYGLVAACSGAAGPDGDTGNTGGVTGMNGNAGASNSGGIPSAHADTGGNDSGGCACEPSSPAPEPEPDVFIDAPCTGSPDSPYVCIETAAESPEDLIGKFNALVRCEEGGAGFGPPGRGFVPMMGIEDGGRICAHCTSPTGNVGSCESGKVVTFRIPSALAP